MDVVIEDVQNPFRFPGQYYDQETGLHYNWNRYYDPKTGRYLTPDPIGLRDAINLFVYVTNNPPRYSDPAGLAPSEDLPDLIPKQTPAYPGAICPNYGSFFTVLRDFMLLGNAVNLINDAADQLDEIAKTVPCCKEILVHVCFNPGPPPCCITVGKDREFLVENKKCIVGTLRGTKDCPCRDWKDYNTRSWRKAQ